MKNNPNKKKKKIQEKNVHPTKEKRIAGMPKPAGIEKNVQSLKLPYFSIVILFLITTAVFFSGQLFGDIFFWEDFVEQYYPWQSYAAREFSEGILPFWNPYTFAGMPFLADLQTGFFYPLNRLSGLFLENDGTVSVWGLQFIVILHYFIAQLSMYHLARYWKTSQIGALIAAVSYGFSFPIVLHGIHPMIVYHLAWFPLVVMFFLKGIKEGSMRNALFAGLILGMSMLAGHPQTTLYEVFFLFILTLWYFISEIKKKEKQVRIPKFFAAALISVIIGAGIFAVQLLPSQELADLAQRNDYTYEEASEGSMQFGQILSSVVPKIYGFTNGSGETELPFFGGPYYFYWDTGYYFGIAALVLAIFGLLTRIKERKIAFLLAMAVFSFLYALGDNFFIWKLFYNLPLFGTFRFPARIIFYLVFAFALIAGFGFDRLMQSQSKKQKLFIAGLLPLLISLLTAAGGFTGIVGAPAGASSEIQSFGVTSLIFVILSFLPMFLLIRGNSKPLAMGAVIVILLFIDLNMAGSSFNAAEKNPEEQYKLHPELKKMLTPQPPGVIFRTAMRMYNPSYMAMKRNQGLIDEIMLIEGYNPLILERVRPPVATTDQMHKLYNVKYEIALNQNNQPYFRERSDMLPRAWMVHSAVISDSSNIATAMKHPGIDYSKTVVLEEKHNLNLPKNTDISSEAKIIEYSSNYIKIKVNAKADGFLILSEIWYPAWKAYVDGKSADVYHANYCFRAVPVTKGNRIVEMRYESEAYAAGFTLSLISLLIAAAGIIYSYIPKRRKIAA